MVVLPLLEIALRRFVAAAFPGSIPFVQHLGLVRRFSRRRDRRTQAEPARAGDGTFLPEGPIRRTAEVLSSTIAA